ncbi:MAG: addiction module protein [Elainellaceae cyanobacterium]
MLTLDQLIAEATALPDSDKTILIEKLMESMTEYIDQNLLREGIQTAQERLAEIKSGAVQTIPGEVALAQVRQLIEP